MYDRIPQELKILRQWVTANNDNKKPLQTAIDISASCTAEFTWTDFDTVCKSVESKERDYIGFVFNDNGIVGIDLDKGFEDGLLTDAAVDIIRHCKSYTEVSKSGRGVHIFVKGDLPFNGLNNGNGIEIYKTGRYFICTGDAMIYSDLISNQDAIDYVVKRYFPEGQGGCANREVIHKPSYAPVTGPKISLKPTYPPAYEGGRHSAMLSVAGQLSAKGILGDDLRSTLLQYNEEICHPPLLEREIDSICKSMEKYNRRK